MTGTPLAKATSDLQSGGKTALVNAKVAVAMFSLLTTLVLTVGKLVIGLVSGSLALVADGAQGLIDVIVTVMVILFIIMGARGACASWTAGRDKLEVMSALIESALLAVTALCIWYLAAEKLLLGTSAVVIAPWQIGLLAAGIVLDHLRARILSKVARQTGSLALEANAMHFQTDAIGSLVVLAGLVLGRSVWPEADVVATLILAGFLSWSAWRIGLRATRVLLDVADPAESMAVLRSLEADPEVMDVSVLRLHRRAQGYNVVATVRVRRDVADWPGLQVRLAEQVEQTLPGSSAVVALVPAA